MQDCLIKARDHKFDVFNALNILDNQEMLKELKFGIGDGNLHYYLYNYRVAKEIQADQVGLILM